MPMEHFHEVTQELLEPYKQVRALIPDVVDSYAALHKAAMGDGPGLSAKMKELIGLAIAITRECDGCVSSHARGAARKGASVEEVADMIGVAILMNGGPGTVWGPRALAAFNEFSQ